jgi:DNA invertase Pin-like site-specific DNA recombinase
VVWAYLRDSGGESQEQSVRQQQNEITAYSARYSLTLARIFADEARTGGTDKGRDCFAELIDATISPENRPSGLLIWSLSRFARNQNDSPYYRAMLRKRNVVIHSLTEVLPDDPTAIVIEAVYDFTNAEKLRQTSRDVKRGLHALARQGYMGGTPPRGYKAEPVIIGHKRDGTPRKVGRWVEDPELWEVAKLAWAMMREGKGYGAINEATQGKLYKSKGCWSTFFGNRTYLGLLKCGDEEIAGVVPPMVDQATWDAVQRIRQERSHPNKRRIARVGLLAGLAYCARCGASMVHSRNKDWHFYICSRKMREGHKSCVSRRVSAYRAEAKVLDAVVSRVFTSEMARELIVEVQARFSDTGALEREGIQLTKSLSDVKRKIYHLNEQIELFGAARSTQTTLLKRETELSELETKYAQWEARKAASQITVTPEALAAVINSWIADLEQARASNNQSAMQNLLQRFVSRVDLGYNYTRITYRFPLDESDRSKATDPPWGHL